MAVPRCGGELLGSFMTRQGSSQLGPLCPFVGWSIGTSVLACQASLLVTADWEEPLYRRRRILAQAPL